MIKIIRRYHQKILNVNPRSQLRTPYDFMHEYKNRSFHSFIRFLFRFVYEEKNALIGSYKSWRNKQVIISHNVTIGKKFEIGPEENIFFIPIGGQIIIGDNVKINTPIELVTSTINFDSVTISIGDGTHIGFHTAIRAAKSVNIGSNCLIAPYVTITDTNAHPLDSDRRLRKEKIPDEEIRPVNIGNNVWIGENAKIGPGVSIGDGSIVGTNSVVIKDIPENTVVLGNPARVASWLKKKEK